MADAVTVTCTEKREGVILANSAGTYTRTFTFPTLNSATGYGDADVISTITIPANTSVKAAFAKSSVTQGSATFALGLDAGSAFVSAVAVTATTTWQPLTIASLANATTGASDQVLTFTVGTATCAAATVTVCLELISLGAPAATFTTYTA